MEDNACYVRFIVCTKENNLNIKLMGCQRCTHDTQDFDILPLVSFPVFCKENELFLILLITMLLPVNRTY